ncbi:AAA domain-containing protein, partial [Thermoproteota archaeon]
RLLKPCIMMSPISVSQFLIPGSIHFDLVVFDEASQIYTEDAIGSIYRGDQFVVAGDPKQLPPTPFFQYVLSDEFDWDEEYSFDLFDSVLDECMSIGLPVQMLKWHYRSKHESLIGFSNENYYDDRLIIFPSSQGGVDELGVDYVYVQNGVYNRGSTRDNPVEAEAITDIVFNQFQKYPDKTVGVVTFSIAQMNKIQDAIDQRLKDNPDFEKFFIEDRLKGFFVKNLENVQGDERDVMIFSVGYGLDEEGRISMNFGPLNKPGGERRLNVAITRAKEKVILVSSIHYDQIILDNTKAPGVHSLHHYLRYAEKRPKKPETDEKNKWHDLDIAQEAASEIEKMGYKVVPRVGVGSFRVELGVLDPDDPDRFILGVLFDGDNYRTAGTTRDRDRLREQILSNNGWRIYKIWSPDWVQQRSIEVKRLETALAKATQNPKTPAHNPVAQKNMLMVSKNQVQERPSNELPQIEPYVLAELKPNSLIKLSRIKNHDRYIKRYRSEVRRLIPQLVKVEAPIHIESTYNRLNKILHIRGTSAQKEAYLDELKKLDKQIRVRGDYLWKTGDDRVSIRAPVKDKPDTNRPIQYIPFEEAYEAMLLVARHSMGLSEQSLINETAHLLGFKSARSTIKQVLTQVYNKAVESGKLVNEDSFIKYNE